VLWAALLAGVVHRIPSIAELRRHLALNPYLRYVCVLTNGTDIPSETTFSRFLSRLVKHEDLLDQCLDDLIQRFAALVPDFGEVVAVDATASAPQPSLACGFFSTLLRKRLIARTNACT
jgi:hypothetical protein